MAKNSFFELGYQHAHIGKSPVFRGFDDYMEGYELGFHCKEIKEMLEREFQEGVNDGWNGLPPTIRPSEMAQLERNRGHEEGIRLRQTSYDRDFQAPDTSVIN